MSIKIKILPKNVIKRIAAGEVIDRPATVIKELIENSIDAQASQINIFVEKGGIKFIYINDNGIGMNKNDLTLCIKKYATNKIYSLNDLDSFKSFGFRGEALTSIKDISRMTITSKTLKQKIAWQLYTEGFSKKIIYLKPISHPVGTTIILSDLFYNFPARRKYISNERIEFIYIKNIIKKIVLIKLKLGIKFKYNNKIIYDFKQITNNISYINRVNSIYGNNFVKNSLEINTNYKKIKLYGLLNIFHQKKISSNFKYFYVNNRIIHNKFIHLIIKKIILNKFNKDYKFSYLIYLEIEPKLIDINIHPKKTDICFYNIQSLYTFIYKSILQKLCNGLIKKIYKNNIIYSINNNLNNNDNELKVDNLENFFIKKNFPKKTKLLFSNIEKKKLVYLDNIPIFNFKNFGKFLIILKNTHIIFEKNNVLYSIKIKKLIFLLLNIKFKLYLKNKNIIKYMKINVKIKLNKKEYFVFYQINKFIRKLGFIFSLNNKYILYITYLPIFSSFFIFNANKFFSDLLKSFFNIKNISLKQIIKWIINYIINFPKIWNYYNIIDLLMELELLKLERNNFSIKELFCLINI
ncbi:DNA mismatch repair endonuclease MutL [Enterobacteriaceae endosymbiont of Donacia versicolorea]|uniref:DNA mismatch repair endonuclease MutL n=1 Tax=Enterobacteriaceae endosymbiont of Donacia versicolorea TaxID=2675788 RepID=UPI0014490921|nr:DNA mismatch repair endonuclease MutL [Enterobacteriaceae endosymbiont of Donacia versicolorea]QJC32041.1 DNA mismatch repair endonuclease MutL [Enterobacteriaceae endosymbiont of Donacia versicolorea]